MNNPRKCFSRTVPSLAAILLLAICCTTVAAADKTDRWLMFRGDASRRATATGGAPVLNLEWRVDANDNDMEPELREQLAQYSKRGVTVLPGLHPLLVSDFVLMRTATRLLAVDIRTGKRIWHASIEEPAEETPTFGPFGFRNGTKRSAQYGRRIWDDATYGTLSSDGSKVFAIEGLSLDVPTNSLEQTSVNRLSAYEVNTGKIRWTIGRQDDPHRRDTFFLGPPLPLEGRLFVIEEIKKEIRLLALEGATGKVLWSQCLTKAKLSVDSDPVRRLAGVSPSYGDGLLICPTGAGKVVAVDLATRALRWNYDYPQPAGETGKRGTSNRIQEAFTNYNGPVPRWLDGVAIVCDGRVLVTPAEADMLCCLNLADGKPCWPAQPRGEHYYVGGVHQGIVALVGRKSIDSIKLNDGSAAWNGRAIAYPGAATLSGHGYRSGNKYYLPLSSGEVAAVDLDLGKIVGTSKPKESAVPGNLISARGLVISQGLDGVEAYRQSDAEGKAR
jgi:outer membrane protein assembly factor BamB